MLAKEASDGYQLRARLQLALGPLAEVLNAGQVYVTLTRLEPALLAAGLVSRAGIDAFRALWHHGETAGFARLMVSSWGRQPISG